MPKQLDLGCGANPRLYGGYKAMDAYGVDIVADPKNNIKQADLALEPIPFADNEFDIVTAYDFLEHIPMNLYLPQIDERGSIVGAYRRDVMIQLFNEIYRVLKPNGLFYSQTPLYPDKSVFQDPTHMSVWTSDSMNYFSGDYFGFHDHYKHTSRFEKISIDYLNDHLCAMLRARKDIPEGTAFALKYD